MLTLDHTGRWRRLGNAARTPAAGHSAGVYGDDEATPLIDRSQWPALVAALQPGPFTPYLPPVRNQGRVGQCNPEATVAAVEYCRAVQGLDFVQLSPADLYARINHGTDGGSYLEDALAEMVGVGVGTAATCGLVWWPGMRQAGAEERARYRVLEHWLCPSFAHCMSAVLAGFALVSGVRWWQQYAPDGEGWMPAVGRGDVGGHALMGYKPALRGGRYGIWHQNSFGAAWGVGGRCVLPEEAYTGAIGGWWAVRQVVTESGELPLLDAA